MEWNGIGWESVSVLLHAAYHTSHCQAQAVQLRTRYRFIRITHLCCRLALITVSSSVVQHKGRYGGQRRHATCCSTVGRSKLPHTLLLRKVEVIMMSFALLSCSAVLMIDFQIVLMTEFDKYAVAHNIRI